jgi:hypothetical protein
MSDLAAHQTNVHRLGAEKPYPRHLVALGVLAFCLAVWAAVIFAVAHYG